MARHENLTVGQIWTGGVREGTTYVLMRNLSGNVLEASGSALPTTAGFETGCIFAKTGSDAGFYVNAGTSTTPAWVPAMPGDRTVYSVFAAGKRAQATSLDGATQYWNVSGPILPTDMVFVEENANTDADADNGLEIRPIGPDLLMYTASADPVATKHGWDWFAVGIGKRPAYGVVGAASGVALSDNATSKDVTVTGILATDVNFAQMHTGGTATIHPSSLGYNTTDTLRIVHPDPGTGTKVSHVTLRPLDGSFTPSHYIYAAGTVAGEADTSVAVTISGLLTTDVCFATMKLNATTEYITNVTPSAGTLTIASSGNLTANSTIAYVCFRAVA